MKQERYVKFLESFSDFLINPHTNFKMFSRSVLIIVIDIIQWYMQGSIFHFNIFQQGKIMRRYLQKQMHFTSNNVIFGSIFNNFIQICARFNIKQKQYDFI